MAVSSTENLYFKNVCGGIKFSVANEGIDKITIKANGDDVISGSLALSTSLDVIKGTSWGNSNPSASLVITAPDGGTFHPGSYYYAVIPASEYTNGFTISYHKGNVAASFVDNNDITIKRSTFKRLYNKDADLQFKPVYDAKALFPSNNILPDGVDKTTITEAHFHVNSDKVTDTVISEGTDDYLICYANNLRPMFDGDMSLKKLNIWVENHLQYPKTLKKAGIQGRVILGFTITKDGELTDVKVRKGVHPLFDAEAIRVIKTTAGHWTGGFDAVTGKPADVTYTYPVIFRLKP